MADMLSRLLQCESRARLLRLLLVEKRQGSVSELARRAGLSPRAVGKEVDYLAELRLVQVSTVGAARLVTAEWGHPAAPLLAQLLQMAGPQGGDDHDQLRESLAAYGAPLMNVMGRAHFPLEATLVKALRASREDGTVVRVLPVVLAKNRDRLDWVDLAESARKEGLKSELGFFLDLTGRLLNDDPLKQRSQTFRDLRRTSMRYLPEPRNRYERELAEAASPQVARDWRFFMNMTEDTFRTLLAKSCPDLKLA